MLGVEKTTLQTPLTMLKQFTYQLDISATKQQLTRSLKN